MDSPKPSSATSSKTVLSICNEFTKQKDMRKLIECPVCMEIPLPPIRLCMKGHIVCNGCQARTVLCPLCREKYSSTRSFVAEGIVEKCVLPCKNSDDGCPDQLKGLEMVQHLKVCDYGPVKCNECKAKCTWLHFHEYLEHLTNIHKMIGTLSDSTQVSYSMKAPMDIDCRNEAEFSWPQYFMKALDQTFLVRLNVTNSLLFSWVVLVGPQSDCSKYKATITLKTRANSEHIWIGSVNHFRQEVQDVYALGRGLITPMSIIMNSRVGEMKSDDFMEWKYSIKLEMCPPTTALEEESSANSSSTEEDGRHVLLVAEDVDFNENLNMPESDTVVDVVDVYAVGSEPEDEAMISYGRYFENNDYFTEQFENASIYQIDDEELEQAEFHFTVDLGDIGEVWEVDSDID